MHTTTPPSPWIRSGSTRDSDRVEERAIKAASTSRGHDHDQSRLWAYSLVALLALLTGYILGLDAGLPSRGSRAGWPSPSTNPRSFNP